jgi:hypothetical protein
MPRSAVLRTCALATCAAVLPTVAGGQGAPTQEAVPPRLRLSVGGGLAENAPFGGHGPGNLGYHLNAAAEVRTPWSPLRLRADGLFANWGDGQHYAGLTGGLVARAPERWRAAPYLMAAAGGYASAVAGGVAPGWTLGGGVRVPLGARAVLVESRMHAFDVGARGLARAGVTPFSTGYGRWQYTYTPLSFGIQF